jgi:hypothetical protein
MLSKDIALLLSSASAFEIFVDPDFAEDVKSAETLLSKLKFVAILGKGGIGRCASSSLLIAGLFIC